MPTVAIVGGVAIRFHPDEHLPPQLLRGSLPATKLNAVLLWANENREGLMEAWAALQAGPKPRRLP